MKIQQESLIILEEKDLARKSAEIEKLFPTFSEDSLVDLILSKLSNNNGEYKNENKLLEQDRIIFNDQITQMTDFINLLADEHMKQKKQNALISLEKGLSQLYYQQEKKENVS